MYPKIEVQSDIILTDFCLRVYNKETNKLILDRYITTKELGIKLFNEQVKQYHNKGIYLITLYDFDKCTNIESYDSDDNI